MDWYERQAAEKAQALSIVCPLCAAEPGKVCRTTGRHLVHELHATRRRAAGLPTGLARWRKQCECGAYHESTNRSPVHRRSNNEYEYL